MTETHIDGRIARGNQTRQLILGRAVDIASVEGLEGLSLGRLANELSLSKSGVFAVFGSKEDLQLATIRAAVKIYLEHVVQPARDVPGGINRVWQVCSNWLTYSRERVFPGGCFFYSVLAEYDALEGNVHDDLVAARTNWFSFLEQTVRDAQAVNEIDPDVDVAQLVFEIVAPLELANAESVLLNQTTAYDRAATAIRNRLRSAATDPALLTAG